MKINHLAFITCLLPVFAEAATTYYVSAETGSDTNNGLSWETATKSIQRAISISSNGDTILVTNGVYVPFSFDNRRIESVNGPNATIIDGQFAGRCVTGSSTNLSIVVGFTICNGVTGNTEYNGQGQPANENNYGAGICSITAIQCVISNNITGQNSHGGGAHKSHLKDCIITHNKSGSGSWGGGGYQSDFNHCIIEHNEADHGGGSSSGNLLNCIIKNNHAVGSGFAGVHGGTIVNCLVVFNYNDDTDEEMNSSAVGVFGECYNSTIACNTNSVSVCSDASGTLYNCVVTRVPGSIGNININNRKNSIASPEDFIDYFGGDFHPSPNSRLLDSGNAKWIRTDIDLDGNPRVSRRGVDPGCYEYPTPIAPEFSAEDGFRFVDGEKAFSITSDNESGVLFYAINDGDFVSANAQSIELTTTETIHVRAFVLAYDRFQSEIVEADIVKVEPCAVVEGVTATWNEAETEVEVEWNVQAEAFSYAVYRGDDDDFDNATQLTNGLDMCRFIDVPGDSDLVYYYWVVGENELGPGQVGDAVATRWAQVATPTISPEDGARFGTASKKVMFSCATAGVKFHYTTDGTEPTTNSPSASAFTLRDTATVKVIAAKNRMRTSEVAAATITRIYVAVAPVLGGIEQVGEGLRFGWNAVEDAESYQVYRGRSPDFTAAELLGETDGTEWSDGTAAAGVPYYYFVLSKNIAGVSSAGAPALGATLTLATAVNAPQLVFSTDVACSWVAVATNGAFDGRHLATSGTPDDSAESCLETTVTGPGQLTFRWKASCEKDDEGNCGWDHLAFRVDGADVVRLDGRSRWEEVTTTIAAGEHTLRWVYAKDEGLSEGDDCGYLDFVQWIPAETKGDWEKWIDHYGLFTDGGYEALKPLPSGKGDTLYEEFVAGLNPLDVLSKFRARIDASVEPPAISWNPDLGDTRTYTVEGKALLTNETWTAPNTDSRFFRVWVTNGED